MSEIDFFELGLMPADIDDMFGGTSHAFDEWLATRPDLANAGTAIQLDEWGEHEKTHPSRIGAADGEQ